MIVTVGHSLSLSPFFCVIIYCLLCPRLSFCTSIPSSYILQINETSNFTSLDSLSAPYKPGLPVCAPVMIGDNLNWDSCRNAWAKIPRTTEPIKYGLHNYRGSRDYTTPFRYLSDDGLCAIDIVLHFSRGRERLGWDITTGQDLSDRAQQVLIKCVILGVGGAIRDYCQFLTPRDYPPIRQPNGCVTDLQTRSGKPGNCGFRAAIRAKSGL